MLSHDAWRRRFGADPAVAGRVIELSGTPFTVIGVGPPRFAGADFEDMADFFVPAMMYELLSPGGDLLRDRRLRGFRMLGRLKRGMTLPEASAALGVLAADLHRQDPVAWRDQAGRSRFITALPEMKARFAGAGPGLAMSVFGSVTAAVVALLAIACINVATVLLARATIRRKEIAVRFAMGASRRRVVRQLLTECALLAAAGGVLGLLLAQTAAGLFARFRPDGVPAIDLTLDYRILLFGIGASLLTVVFFGLAPALQTTRPDFNAELKDTSRAVRVRGFRFGLRSVLVVIQVAVSLALMIGASLMLRSAHAGLTEDPGFRRDGVVSVGIDLSTIPDRGGAHARFYEEAVRIATELPGVEQVALAAVLPMSGENTHVSVRIAVGASEISTTVDANVVGPGYFSLLDIPVTQGREFTTADRESSTPVALVNETMARYFWNGHPVGQSFFDTSTRKQTDIVGVLGDLRHRSFSEAPLPMVYFSAGQRPRPRMTMHLRTAAPPRAIGPVLLAALHDIDRAAGLTRAETMDEYFGRVTQHLRLGAGAAMATAGLELALSVMALYGVIAFAASQRRREIGLRMAGGVALGTMLIGVGPADPVSFGAGVAVLLLVGAGASYLPARSALRVDPSTALRSE